MRYKNNEANRDPDRFKNYSLLHQLVSCFAVFDEIDLNGNGDLEWDEFTNYVIEKATVLNNIKSKADEIKQYTRSLIKPIESGATTFGYKDNFEKFQLLFNFLL